MSYDLVVLGAGPGGYVAAIRAAQHGLKTAIVEAEALGGVCLNWGCIPTKSLIESALKIQAANYVERFGMIMDKRGFSYGAMQKESRTVSARLSKGVQHLLDTNGVEVIRDFGRIDPAGKVVLASDGRTLESANIIIATGSREKELPGFEFNGSTILNSRDMLGLETLPKEILILGAGAIGVEFSFILATLGVSVTLVELMERILPLEDEEVSVLLEKELRKLGIRVMTSTKALSCASGDEAVQLTVSRAGQSSVLTAETLLVAVGRTPNIEDIGLESAGIAVERGHIVTKEFYETTVPGIFAVGDVNGQAMLAHVASRQGIIAADCCAGKADAANSRIDDHLIPKAVYCEPQVASFGLGEASALKQYKHITVSRFPFRGCGKAVATNQAEGFVKIIADSATREILGASIIGPQATEILHELLLAKTAELVPEDLLKTLHAHPTFSEAVLEAAEGLFGKAIHV